MSKKIKNTDLKMRVLKAKSNLPKSGVTSLFFHFFKDEYRDTKYNRDRLTNVLQSRVVDKEITENLESLVVLLSKNQKK